MFFKECVSHKISFFDSHWMTLGSNAQLSKKITQHQLAPQHLLHWVEFGMWIGPRKLRIPSWAPFVCATKRNYVGLLAQNSYWRRVKHDHNLAIRQQLGLKRLQNRWSWRPEKLHDISLKMSGSKGFEALKGGSWIWLNWMGVGERLAQVLHCNLNNTGI